MTEPGKAAKPISGLMNALLSVVFLAGIAALSYGAWLAWRPGGFLVGGAFGVLIPVLYARGAWAASSKT